MKALHKNILERLYQIINDTVKHIHPFIDDPYAFTRKRTLDAATVHFECGPYIVTMDRGYTSFNMIENCDRDFSCHVTTSNFYYITHKAHENIHHVNHHYHQYIKYRSKNTQDRNWDFGELCTIKFRACKFKINDSKSGKEEWEVVLTNLDRKTFPLQKIKELYHLRWGIKSSFRKLKYSLGCVEFHSKQDKFIEMEFYAHMIMFNAISQIDAQAYIPQRHCKYQYAINFKQSSFIIQSMYLASSLSRDFERILIQISYYTIPIRPGYKDERNIISKYFNFIF